MPKQNTQPAFFCSHCGYESGRWMGFCPACGQRSPLVEAPAIPSSHRNQYRLSSSKASVQELSQVSLDATPRSATGFGELDRVLGGGLVPGSLVLMAGEPGIGKSTLLIQVAQSYALAAGKVMYVSGEESDHQVRLRAERLTLSGKNIFFVSETGLDSILECLDTARPSLGVIDSIQTLYSDQVQSGPGSIAQVRECTLRLMEWAKDGRVPLLIASHVTKDGVLAGPRILEHMVDVVLYLEGERMGPYRLVRSVKNRFGSTNEVGVFQMGARGLEEVADPSRILIAERREHAVGSVIVPVLEGSRPLLVEIQALTSPSLLAVPRRVANGIDQRRLMMLGAVLTQRAGLRLANQDVVVNVVGGLSVSEPACDLAVALSIASSFRNVPIPSDWVVIGEVGLSGEIRGAPQLDRRVAEAVRLGFSHFLVPSTGAALPPSRAGVHFHAASTLRQAIQMVLPLRERSDDALDI